MAIDFDIHPEYKEHQPNWEMYDLLYKGDQTALKRPTYLWAHELEKTGVSAPDYAPNSSVVQIPPGMLARMIREQRSTYTNYLEPVISRWQSVFFKTEPRADAQVQELFGDDINDVTGDGKSLNTWIKDDVLTQRLLFGRPIIMTDAPDMVARNRAEQEALKLKPFFRMLPPLEVMDWEIETQAAQKGQFKWLRWEYSQIEPRANARIKAVVNRYCKELIYEPIESNVRGIYYYNIYRLENDNQTNKAEWVKVQGYAFPGFPNLPVRSIECEQSWVKDVAPIALKLFNLESARDNILLYQAYQRSFIASTLSEPEKMAMGAYVIGFLPQDSVIHTIEPASTASIDNNIGESRVELRAVAFNQGRQVSLDSKAVEGADTQREYKENLTAVVKSELETLENLVNNAIKDYAWFKTSQADFQGKVTFSRDVDLSDLVQEIMFYQQLRDDVKQFPTWRKALLKKFASSQNLPEAAAIVKEIDAATFEQEQSPVQVADRRSRLLGAINGGSQGDTEGADQTDS